MNAFLALRVRTAKRVLTASKIYVVVKMALKFTATEDGILINCVRDFRALFDAQHEDYKNQAINDYIWEMIGKKVGQNR